MPGPTLVKEHNEKRLKKVRKEGGKKGVEIEGAADMGGLQFFCTNVDTPEGDLDLLVEVVKSMNAISDPSEEERKGGAGKIGKMVFNYVDKPSQAWSAVAYVPKHKEESCSAQEWLQTVLNNVVGESKAPKAEQVGDCPLANWAKVRIPVDSSKDIFPIKYRDPAITMAYDFLRKKDLFPVDDDDDDDEMVFGDEDFP